MMKIAKKLVDVMEDVLTMITFFIFGVGFFVSVIMYHDNKADIEVKAKNPLLNPVSTFTYFSPVALTENLLDVILWEER